MLNTKNILNKKLKLNSDNPFKSIKIPKALPKQKAMFSGMYSEKLNKFNLKHFGGKNDFDFDGVPNKFDCQPKNTFRQDFTPFNNQSKAEKLSAARRFGGQNLKGLKKLGQGRDRVVYALDNDKVLKIAKNPGGLTQNTSESDIEYLGMGTHYETGLDYSVMSRNNSLSPKSKKKLAKVRKTYRDEYENNGRQAVNDFGRNDAPMQLVRRSEKFSGDDSVLDEVGIGRDVLDYNFNPHELFANRQWGEDNEGNLALNDGGALQDNDSLRKHKVKDFPQDTWQAKDWNEVQRQRRQHRDKGNYNPRDPVPNQSDIPNDSFNALFGDDDGDGVLNHNDCAVNDPDKQGPWHAPQSLWHAGNQPPSETLKKEGRVYGFSSKEYAEGWKEKHNKDNLYQFTTNNYTLDDKTYSRPLPGNKTTLSDNEYIAREVSTEQPYMNTESDNMKSQQELYNEEEIEHMKKAQDYNKLETYGRVSKYSGNTVGNAMIAADIVIPSAKTITLAGLGVKKYVDNVKLIHTDEADKEYIIPRVEVERKNSKFVWESKNRGL